MPGPVFHHLSGLPAGLVAVLILLGVLPPGALAVSPATSPSASVLVSPLDTPLASGSQNPMARIFGLPVAESARLLAQGEQSLGLSLDIANNFNKSSQGLERIWLDSETLVTTLRYRYGGKSLQWGMELPYVHFSGGRLDSFIDKWHGWFGFPDGNRDLAANNQFDYVYTNVDGQREIDLHNSSSGIGDVRFAIAVPLASKAQRALSLRSELKLPTGDSDKLHGSGGSDISLGLSGYDSQWLSGWQSTVHGTAGILWTEKGDVLRNQREQIVAYATLAMVYQYSGKMAFKLQLDGHTAFYDNSFDTLGESMQLAIGGTLSLADEWLLDMAVVEDILVNSTSDVVFHLNLKHGF
jgi:hypothetical protein